MDKPNQVPQGVSNPHIAALMQSTNPQLRFPASTSTPQNSTQYTQQFQPDFVASHFAQLSQQQFPIQQTNDPALQLNQNFAINSNHPDSQDESPPPKEIKEQEMFLPKENIRKVMKKVLPTYAKISKEAVDCIQECATEFILFVLGEASDIAQTQKRKIVSGGHVVEAFHTLGLDFYSQLMSTYLQQLKASQVTSTKNKKRKRNKDASESDEPQDENSNETEEVYEQQEAPSFQPTQPSNVAQEIMLPNQQYRNMSPNMNMIPSAMNTITNNNNNNNNTTTSNNNNAVPTGRTALPSLEQLQELYRQLYPNSPVPSYQSPSQASNQNQTNNQNSNGLQQPIPQTNYRPQAVPPSTYAPQPSYSAQPGTYPQQVPAPYQQPQPTQQTSSYSQQANSFLTQPSPNYPQTPTAYPPQNTSTAYSQQVPASYPQQQPQQPGTFPQQPNVALPNRPAIPMDRVMSFIQQMAQSSQMNNPPSNQQQPNKRT